MRQGLRCPCLFGLIYTSLPGIFRPPAFFAQTSLWPLPPFPAPLFHDGPFLTLLFHPPFVSRSPSYTILFRPRGLLRRLFLACLGGFPCLYLTVYLVELGFERARLVFKTAHDIVTTTPGLGLTPV